MIILLEDVFARPCHVELFTKRWCELNGSNAIDSTTTTTKRWLFYWFFLSLWENPIILIGMSSRILGEFVILLRFSEFAINYFNMNTIFIKLFKCYAVHIHFIALHTHLIIHFLIFVYYLLFILRIRFILIKKMTEKPCYRPAELNCPYILFWL